MAQSTIKLIVDAQNAIRPLQRVNEQTKALSSSTDKLKGRLDKSNRSLRNTGRAAKTASTGVATLTKALAPLLAAATVLSAARFVFVKTAELETQRASLEQLTGSLEKTNKIIDELQAFGAVTPFTSSELIEQTKRLKAFGFETEELVDTTKRLSDVAGATGADLTGIATAFGQIRAKGKLQQEENLQLLERGVNITNELKKITGLQGDEFESAMRKGKIGADLVNQALINLTSQGGIFAGGATKQADTLNGKLSTLQDTIDTLARTIGTELEDEIKGVLDFGIAAVKAINELIKNFGILKKAIDVINPFEQLRSLKEQLTIQKKLADSTNKIRKINVKNGQIIEITKDKTKETTQAYTEGLIPSSDLFNKNLDLSGFFLNDINNDTLKISDSFQLIKTDADLLNEKFMEIGQSVEQGIVSNLTDAVMGTQSLGQAAINVLNNLKRKLIEVQIERAVSGIGDNIGGFLGGVFGGGKKRSTSSSSLVGNTASSFLGGAIPSFVGGGISSLLGFANGGRPPVGRASLVGEKGPELFVPKVAGTIIPNDKIGGGTTNNYVTVNVEAGGATASGNNVDLNALGQVIGVVVQAQLVKEKQAGGILAR